jgi:predicted acylesterase/phospholipase RssA
MRRLWSVCGFLLAGTLASGGAATAQTPCQAGVPRALVLSGGGSKGAFEAGAMYHLIVHRGCDFVDIAGVSVGGLNASYVGAAPMGPTRWRIFRIKRASS